MHAHEKRHKSGAAAVNPCGAHTDLFKTASQDDESGLEENKVRRQDLLVRQQRSPACPSGHRAATPTVGLVSLSAYRVPRADFRFPRFVYAVADPVDD